MKWSFYALILGFCIDLLLGDPHGFPHPVVLIGKLIDALGRLFRALLPKTKPGEIAAGALLWVFTAAVSTAIPALLLIFAQKISVWLRLALESVMCWQILATKSLRDESMKVYAALQTGSLSDAQRAVSMIVGRDTERLDEKGVARAAVETVAENTSDGVIAPLLFLSLGGAPLGFFYKAVNTMDSMLGYKHASPNSAQTESVCAGLLGLRLAGDAWYHGVLHKKEFIGDAVREIEYADIPHTCRLMELAAVLALIVCCAIKACFIF